MRRITTGLFIGGCLVFCAGPFRNAEGQASALTDLMGKATDFNFYWLQTGSPLGDLKPEHRNGARGVGFELSFDIPGGVSRTKRARRIVHPTVGKKCIAKYKRMELAQDSACKDTSWILVKRDSSHASITYEQSVKIEEFEWTVPLLSLEFAVGFTQTGAFVSRRAENDLRVSLREAPSVSIYANYEPAILSLKKPFKVRFSAYAGARSGLVSLNGGRAFTPDSTTKFGGETFQLGPVVGLVAEVWGGVNAFVEGAYTWRDFKSVEWERTTGLGTLPRRMNMSGASLALGVQFDLKDEKDEKK